MSYHLERIQGCAEAYVASGQFAGVEWHIEQGGSTRSQGRAGLADPLTGAALPEVPIYRIYSMTKPLVAAVAVMLIDEGRLRLLDPVSRYVPAFGDVQVLEADGTTRPASTPLLVEHLFTHRSGLSYQWQRENPLSSLYLERLAFQNQHSLEDLVTSLAELPLFADPGTTWHYSFSLDVLAHIVTLVEGKPLAEVLAERLFSRLGTVDTAFFVPEAERSRILPTFVEPESAPAGDPSDQSPTLAYAPSFTLYPADDPDFARGGLGLFSTLLDYTKLARFLLTGLDATGARILSKKGVDALWTNRLPEHQTPISIGGHPKYAGYGFGLGGRVLIRPHESPFYSAQGEAGWEGAATTYFWIDPRNDVAGVVLSQFLGQRAPLGEDIRAAFYQSLD